MPPETMTSPMGLTTAATSAARPAADPYRDHEAIKQRVRTKMTEWEKGRENFVVAAWFNILFYRGHHWIRYDRVLRRIRPAIVPRRTPTPVTNKFAETMDAVISIFARVEPTLQFRPGSEEPEDRATADVADRAMEVIEDEVKIRTLRQRLAAWVGLTGIAWLETGYDPDPRHGTRLLQHDACVMCGLTAPPALATSCPACGGSAFVPATDGQGAPVGEQVPVGRMYADIVPLFEMYFDPGVADWTKQTEYCRKKSVLVEEAKARWPHLREVIRPNVMATGVSELYTDALPTLGPNLDDTQGLRHILAGAGRRPENTRVTEEWFWAQPDATYPEGLLAVIVGGEHVGTAGPLPYRARRPDGSATPLLPHICFQLKMVPGSAMGKTVADDLRLKQAQRNRIESLIEAILMRCGNPIWLRPIGTNAVNLTGEPGQVVDYNPVVAGGLAKPERIPGQSIPAGLMNYMALIDRDFEALAGCLDGQTEVPCLDGRSRTMSDLARDFRHGGVWVYGFDPESMRVVPSLVEAAWSSGIKPCVRVTFEEGTFVDCTADHPFLTWGRGYIEAKDLRPGEALVPCVVKSAREPYPYTSVLQPVDRQTEPVHRMVAKALLGLGRSGDGRDVHHRDHNEFNNVPENLEVLTRSEHTRRHAEKWRDLVATPEEQARRSDLRWRGTTDDERREAVAPMLAAREAHWAALSDEERSAIRRKRWIRATPEHRRKVAEAMRAGWRRTPEERSEAARARWAACSQEERDARGAAMRAARRPNHRVAAVRPIGERETFDLQTSTHNFGTAAGVFVHNTFDVLKGARPEGVSAGIALQILQERGMSRWAPVFILWESAWAEWARQALEIFRDFVTEPRLLRIKGRDSQWRVQKFLGADLQGQVDVIAEAASAMPRSSLVERAETEQLIALGVLPVNDPDVRLAILEQYGQLHMLPGLQRDTENAIRENEVFDRLAQDPRIAAVPPEYLALAEGLDYSQLVRDFAAFGVELPEVNPALDDHAIHGREHRNYGKSEHFRALPRIIRLLLEKKTALHDLYAAQQMQALVAARAGTQPTAGFLAPTARANQTPMRSGSSPERLEGEGDEMGRDVAAGSGLSL